MQFDISPKQHKALTSEYEEVFVIAGIGFGKSLLGGMFSIEEAGLIGSLGLITAPTSDTLNNSTMPQLKHIWADLGLIEDVHYVIGRMPPKEWGIPSYTKYNGKILTWRWGSYAIIDGSDNYNKHRGLELDWVFADELRDIRIGAWEMYRGRMRGKAKKAIGAKYKMLACTTPPDNPQRVEKLQNVNVEVIRGTSFDNARNLPDGYLEGLKSRYDEITYKREVLGEMIYLGGTVAYYSFSIENIVMQDFVPNARTVMCWDFNASAKKPMSTCLVQEIGGLWYITKEFAFKNSNTEEQCQRILEFLNDEKFTGSLEVTGDYSGNRKESNSSDSDFAIIEFYFRNFADYMLVTRPTRRVKDRIAALNAQFRNMVGERNLFVDCRCVKYIEDLQATRWKENGVSLDDTDPERTHLSDSISYWAYNYYPTDFVPMTTS